MEEDSTCAARGAVRALLPSSINQSLRLRANRPFCLNGKVITTERTGMMEKARAKRQRRAEVKAAKKASQSDNLPDTDPNTSFTEKVVDLAQGAVAHVGDLLKVAASKLSFVD